MMEGGEAAGELVTGAMIARAVERHGGDAGTGGDGTCLNCGTALVGGFCHACGQPAHVHRTLTAWWHDLAHGVLHMDGKIWRTLPMLAWRPGELTRRYVEGERARFVSPLALFLFSVFLMFAVFSAIGSSPFGAPGGASGQAEANAEAERDYRDDRAKAQARLDGLRKRRAELAARGASTADTDRDIADAARDIALEDRLRVEELELEKRLDGGGGDGPVEMDMEGAPSSVAWLNHAYRKAKANPSLLAYKLQANGYKFSWALIPISVPFVWLLFLHRRRYRAYRVYDHTIFVTYSIAFMSLGAVTLALLGAIGLDGLWVALPAMLAPPLHMYRQLRGAYMLSRWSAAWRTFALLVFAGVAGTVFFLLLLMVGLLG